MDMNAPPQMTFSTQLPLALLWPSIIVSVRAIGAPRALAVLQIHGSGVVRRPRETATRSGRRM